MAFASGRTARVIAVPRWPTVTLSFFAVVATASLLQGIVDLVIPALTGGKPFDFLFQATELWGPVFFGAYVFVHNLGLACLVPGIGFLAVYFEKHPPNRRLVGLLLVGSVIGTLLVSLEYIVQSGRFDLVTTIPLFLAEAVGVLILAVPAARELRGFVPTPAYGWSLVTPYKRLATPFAASFVLLLACTVVETWMVLGA